MTFRYLSSKGLKIETKNVKVDNELTDCMTTTSQIPSSVSNMSALLLTSEIELISLLPWIFFRITFLRSWLWRSRIRRRIRRGTLAHIRKNEKAANGNEEKSSEDKTTWKFVQELLTTTRRLLHRDWQRMSCRGLNLLPFNRLLLLCSKKIPKTSFGFGSNKKYRKAPPSFVPFVDVYTPNVWRSCSSEDLPWLRREEGEDTLYWLADEKCHNQKCGFMTTNSFLTNLCLH